MSFFVFVCLLKWLELVCDVCGMLLCGYGVSHSASLILKFLDDIYECFFYDFVTWY